MVVSVQSKYIGSPNFCSRDLFLHICFFLCSIVFLLFFILHLSLLSNCLSHFPRNTPSLDLTSVATAVSMEVRLPESGVMFHCRILLSAAADLCKGVVIIKSVDGRTRASKQAKHASQRKTYLPSFIVPSSCTASVNLAAIIEI